jgi:hypothetical protein
MMMRRLPMGKYVVKWQEVLDYEMMVQAVDEDDAWDTAFANSTFANVVSNETFHGEIEEISEESP